MAEVRTIDRGRYYVSESTSSPTRAVWVVGPIIGGLVLLGDVKTTWSFSGAAVVRLEKVAGDTRIEGERPIDRM